MLTKTWSYYFWCSHLWFGALCAFFLMYQFITTFNSNSQQTIWFWKRFIYVIHFINCSMLVFQNRNTIYCTTIGDPKVCKGPGSPEARASGRPLVRRCPGVWKKVSWRFSLSFRSNVYVSVWIDWWLPIFFCPFDQATKECCNPTSHVTHCALLLPWTWMLWSVRSMKMTRKLWKKKMVHSSPSKLSTLWWPSCTWP